MRRIRQQTKRRLKRWGATTVEFAFVSSIIFATFLAAAEFCRLSMMRHTLDNAVYEAARKSIVPGATAKEIESQAKSILSTLGISNARVSVDPQNITDETEFVTVKVDLPLNESSFIPVNSNMSRSLKMRRERSL
ncbi:MAG: pilus assembly protein [Planctomycetaceae bacterium]|nr:pilus assembly protein [Planctomycetaceae bacterium]